MMRQPQWTAILCLLAATVAGGHVRAEGLSEVECQPYLRGETLLRILLVERAAKVELACETGVAVLDGPAGQPPHEGWLAECALSPGTPRAAGAKLMILIEGFGSDAEAAASLEEFDKVVRGAAVEQREGVGPVVIVPGGSTAEESNSVLRLVGKRLPEGAAAFIVPAETPAATVGAISLTWGEGQAAVSEAYVQSGARDVISLRALRDDGQAILDGGYRGSLQIIADPESKSLRVINHVSLEEYVAGVVGSEMPVSAPPSALQAQAIASRSFALSRLTVPPQEDYDLGNGQVFQVYNGARGEDPRVIEAVAATRGLILAAEGRVAACQFHSTCGGLTEDAHAAFPSEEHGLVGVRDAADQMPRDRSQEKVARRFILDAATSYCSESPYFRWRKRYTREELDPIVAAGVLRVAGKRIGTLRDIRISERSSKARVMKIEVVGSEGTVPIEGDQLRLALGEGGRLPSTLFGIEKRQGEGGGIEVFEFFGGGFGHGVGMCQFGAMAMARNGSDRDIILRHYYPGCKLSRPGGAL